MTEANPSGHFAEIVAPGDVVAAVLTLFTVAAEMLSLVRARRG